jgi:hypothetical protein
LFCELFDVDVYGIRVGEACGRWGNGGETSSEEEFGVEINVQRAVVGQDAGV